MTTAELVSRSTRKLTLLTQRAGLQSSVEERRRRIETWLATQQYAGDVALVSAARPFADPEEEYDEAIGSRHAKSAGAAVYGLWREVSGRDLQGGLALELGAGSGAVTMGFVQAADGFMTLVTEPSLEFLSMIQRKLSELSTAPGGSVRYATLLGEDVTLLPRNLFDVVYLQACLHHVANWQQLIQDIWDILVPGGVLVFQEPFSEGTYFMALAAEILMEARGIPDADRERLDRMRNSIYLLSDRTVNKDHGEDKHCFYTDETIGIGHEIFGNLRFLRNQSFESISEGMSAGSRVNLGFLTSPQGSASSFTDYCRAFFVQHYGLSSQAMTEFDKVVVPRFVGLDTRYRLGDGPALLAVVVCRKDSSLRTKALKLRKFVAKKVNEGRKS